MCQSWVKIEYSRYKSRLPLKQTLCQVCFDYQCQCVHWMRYRPSNTASLLQLQQNSIGKIEMRIGSHALKAIWLSVERRAMAKVRGEGGLKLFRSLLFLARVKIW